MGQFEVTVGAGSLRSDGVDAVRFPHRWTPEGVTVEAQFTGAHLLHLAAAGCVLNDMYREAERLQIVLSGVRVRAAGGFDSEAWSSTGIEYDVEVDSDAAPDELEQLVACVDEIAEIPRAIRHGAAVKRAR
jgi:hypothetical protein